MGFLKEFAVKLGLDVDAISFAKGQIAVTAIGEAIGALRSVVGGLGEAIFGFNAHAEGTKLRLAAIASLNLKLPWVQAKAAAEDFFVSLQESVAETPATVQEMADITAQLGGAFLKAGKNMDDLKKFIPGLTVAMKTFGHEAIAPLEVQEAIMGIVTNRQVFSRMLIEQGLGMKREEFISKNMKTRADLLMQAVNSPTMKAAMNEYKSNWAGVTSTIKSDLASIAGSAGKPLFEFVKGALGDFGTWIRKNKDDILAFFGGLSRVLFGVGRTIRAVVGFFAMLVKWFYSFGPIAGSTYTLLAALAVAMAIFGVESVTAAIASATAWIAAALPIIAIAALIGVALLLIEDLYTGLTGGKSLIFELWDEWKKFMASWLEDKDEDPWWLKIVKEFLKWIFKTDEAWSDVVEAWKQIFSDFVEWVEGLFADLWKGIKQAARDALDAINPFSSNFNAGNPFKLATENLTAPSELTPRNLANITLSPQMRIDSLTVQTTGEPNDVVSKVRQTIEEHFDGVLRATKAALAGDR